ncbi:MAG: hypothetical protein HC767_15675 [Akkermansiaceae bacterium]|nr:hypothetical protein [Akkermansiaceae bacterium]
MKVAADYVNIRRGMKADYDGNGNVTQYTDPDGNVTTYTYDGNWKLQAENGADGYHVSSVHWNYAATTQARKAAATAAAGRNDLPLNRSTTCADSAPLKIGVCLIRCMAFVAASTYKSMPLPQRKQRRRPFPGKYFQSKTDRNCLRHAA